MSPTPEEKARKAIDEALGRAGWLMQDAASSNIYAGRGVARREFPLKQGHGFADYLLYVDGKAAGVVEAKKDAMTPPQAYGTCCQRWALQGEEARPDTLARDDAPVECRFLHVGSGLNQRTMQTSGMHHPIATERT